MTQRPNLEAYVDRNGGAKPTPAVDMGTGSSTGLEDWIWRGEQLPIAPDPQV